MQELGNIAWCPVLAEAPVVGLPWPSSGERVAPPRGTRPLSEAWLCSSTLRLLSTECRHATGYSLPLPFTHPGQCHNLSWHRSAAYQAVIACNLALCSLCATPEDQPGTNQSASM